MTLLPRNGASMRRGHRKECRSRAVNGRAALWLVLGLLAGCVRYEPRPIDADASARAWSVRTLDDPGLRSFIEKASAESGAQWPLEAWDLDHLTLAAIYEQPDLELARIQWRVADAGNVTARERPNPSINALPTYDTTTLPPWIPAVFFDVPIETAGKRGDRIAQARATSEAAKWSLVDRIWQIRSDVRTAMLGVYYARESARLLEREEASLSEEVRLLEGQAAAGAIGASDLISPRISLNSTKIALQQARQQQSEALGALAGAVGLPNGALEHAVLSFDGLDRLPSVVAPAEVTRLTILERADVRGALASYAASQAALQLEIANQYPDVHLGPGYELDQTDNKWSLGFTLALPILNQNEGPIAEAKARRSLAAATFISVQSKAINEADLALRVFRDALEEGRTAQAMERQLKQRLDSAISLRKAGESDPLAVAEAEVEYCSGAIQNLDALLRSQQAIGRLEAAMQSSLVFSEQLRRAAESGAHPDATHPYEP
jgi:cobalt-zinc-cadmium efflux system outer membrane protein